MTNGCRCATSLKKRDQSMPRVKEGEGQFNSRCRRFQVYNPSVILPFANFAYRRVDGIIINGELDGNKIIFDMLFNFNGGQQQQIVLRK